MKSIKIILFLSLSNITIMHAAQQEKSPVDIWKDQNNYYSRRDKAIQEFRIILQSVKENPAGRNAYGQGLMKFKEYIPELSRDEVDGIMKSY